MEELLNEIEKGLEVGLYQVSLGMALCIPDICAALESKDGLANGSKYKEWYNKYINGETFYMTADDCYYFRCSFLHQGSTKHNKSQYSRIIFAEPVENGSVFHNNIINGTLNIDINTFCKMIIKAARKWLNEVKDNEYFIKNSKNSFKKHPNGLWPLIEGISVYG